MNYEVQGELNEQSKSVVVSVKVKLCGEGESVDKEYLEKLLLESSQAAVKEFELMRPFAEAMTIRKNR